MNMTFNFRIIYNIIFDLYFKILVSLVHDGEQICIYKVDNNYDHDNVLDRDMIIHLIFYYYYSLDFDNDNIVQDKIEDDVRVVV